MPGAVTQKMLDRSESEEKAKARRRTLKQKVRRGEVLKLINLGIKRYDDKRRASRIDRRIRRAIATRYMVWDLRLTNIAVSLRVIGQRRLLEPVLDRVFGRTLVERD